MNCPLTRGSSACYLENGQGGGTARPSWRGYAQDTKRNSIKEVFEEVDPEVQVLGSKPRSCRDSTPLAGRNQAALVM